MFPANPAFLCRDSAILIRSSVSYSRTDFTTVLFVLYLFHICWFFFIVETNIKITFTILKNTEICLFAAKSKTKNDKCINFLFQNNNFVSFRVKLDVVNVYNSKLYSYR